MSVVINTNYSATLASNNLATSNASLQKSLNRLSSGTKIVSPADDAGGLAVSMKLGAASRRQGAVSSNIGNAASLLQTQDGNLKVVARVLDRISELKMLHSDVTKNASDKANYNSEFTALQAQLTAIGSEKFNGVALFGSTDLTIKVTEDGSASSAVTAKAVELIGTTTPPVFASYSDSFANLSAWTIVNGFVTVTPGTPNTVDLTSSDRIQSNQVVSGPFEINFDYNYTDGSSAGSRGIFFVDISGTTAMVGLTPADSATHHIRMVFDGSGGVASYLDSSTSAFQTLVAPASGQIEFGQNNGSGTHVSNFSVTAQSAGSTPSNVGTVAAASDLGALNLSTVTSAIQDVATYRAQNGATQSRLGFAGELLTTNKANLEAANSRIIDVDVASESTQLARFNTLVQAGTSMLSQANQSSQTALRLLQ